ncbi:phage holin family protein [Patescibacteria group bacterium]|nr:MAG: phage holin family protein [Patescibacteria group bacterium]
MRKQFAVFLIRWLLNSFGLWIASRLLGGGFDDTNATTTTFLIAGLVLSLVNSLVKPVVVVLSLPAILVTLGLFMLVVNGLMVYIALNLVPHLDISFFSAILTGIIISLINYIISGFLELNQNKREIPV